MWRDKAQAALNEDGGPWLLTWGPRVRPSPHATAADIRGLVVAAVLLTPGSAGHVAALLVVAVGCLLTHYESVHMRRARALRRGES